MPYDLTVAIPTLVGSLLSFVATSCVLISYIIYANQQRSFRHALVLNLALAEFINSLNNSISGIYAIANNGSITAGPACSLNGWVGQWSVQAADFSILAIAIITLLTITRKTYMPNASLSRKILICGSVWVIPTITASTAAGLKELTPVSGNWCWISGERTDLRYVLGHGWRYSIIFATIGIYVYIWIYMKRHFTKLNVLSIPKSYNQGSATKRREFLQDDAIELRSESQTNLHEINVAYHYEVKYSDGRSASSIGKDELEPSIDLEKDGGGHDEFAISPTSPKSPRSPTSPNSPYSPTSPKSPYVKGALGLYPAPDVNRKTTTVTASGPATHGSGAHQSETPQYSGSNARNVEAEIRKMLLLNAYPVLYIILWLPGILNRLVEAGGSSSYPLTVLQCSTQYIGLANAITYGFNENLKTLVKVDLMKWYKTRRG